MKRLLLDMLNSMKKLVSSKYELYKDDSIIALTGGTIGKLAIVQKIWKTVFT